MPASTDFELSNDDDAIDSMLTDDNMPATIPDGFACTTDDDIPVNPGADNETSPESTIVIGIIIMGDDGNIHLD